MMVQQYDIFIVNLNPAIGSEIKKTRPCVVLSPDEMNKHLATVVIAPVTSQSKNYPTRVKIHLEGNENWAVIDQIRTIDKSRLTKKISQLYPMEIALVKKVIKETFVD